MRKIKWGNVFPYLFTALILIGLVVYLCQNLDRYQQLFVVSPILLVLLFITVISSIVLNGLVNVTLYRALDANLSYKEGIGLGVINTIANQLPFAGGLVAKGVYLKNRFKMPYTHYLSATMALYVCFVAVNGYIALAVLGYWGLISKAQVPLVLTLGFLLMGFSVVTLWIPIDKIPIPKKLKISLSNVSEGWSILTDNFTLLFKLSTYQVIMVLLFATRLWISFHIFSQNVTFYQCLLFSSATILTRLVAIAPGGLGVREGIVAGIASILGFETGVSIIAVGFDRLFATTFIFLLSPVFSYDLSKNISRGKE